MTVSLEQAQSSLAELIARLSDGELVVITRDEKPVAELRPVSVADPVPTFGSCRGMLRVVADDDEHLADFGEHMR